MKISELEPGDRFRFLPGATHHEKPGGWTFLGMGTADTFDEGHAIADDGAKIPVGGTRGVLFDPDDPVELVERPTPRGFERYPEGSDDAKAAAASLEGRAVGTIEDLEPKTLEQMLVEVVRAGGSFRMASVPFGPSNEPEPSVEYVLELHGLYQTAIVSFVAIDGAALPLLETTVRAQLAEMGRRRAAGRAT